MGNRRAILDGLSRILGASAPEELFAGGDDQGAFIYELLVAVSRAEGPLYQEEVSEIAGRHGVSVDYVADRAAVLLVEIRDRRRADLYRLLGVPPLASGEAIRRRWLEVVKQSHPDTGGDAACLRRAQRAYEILRDPDRRTEYDRFWRRAVGPFDRFTGGDEGVPPVAAQPEAPLTPQPLAERRPATPPASRPCPSEGSSRPAGDEAALPGTARATLAPSMARVTLGDAARLPELRGGPDRRVDEAGYIPGLFALVGQLESLLAQVSAAEIERLRTDVALASALLESLREEMDAIAILKRRLNA